MFFVAAAGFTARERGEFQVDQFMNDGEFNIVQRGMEGKPVIRRVEHTNDSGSLILIPMNIAERVGPKIGRMDGKDGDLPILQMQTLLPKGQLLRDELFGEGFALARIGLGRSFGRETASDKKS